MSQLDDFLQVQAPCADLKSVVPDPPPAREPAQRTLSAIGDVGVALSDAAAQPRPAPRRHSWITLLAFTAVAYALALGASWLLAGHNSRLIFFVVPLAPTLAAFCAFWAYQEWKQRAQERLAKLTAWQRALDALAYQSANAANAIRANLLGMESAHSDAARAAHLKEINLAARRLEAVAQRASTPR